MVSIYFHYLWIQKDVQIHTRFTVSAIMLRNRNIPGVYCAPTVSLPGIIVAHIVDQHILFRLGRQDIPGVLIMQVLVVAVVQHCRVCLLHHRDNGSDAVTQLRLLLLDGSGACTSPYIMAFSAMQRWHDRVNTKQAWSNGPLGLCSSNRRAAGDSLWNSILKTCIHCNTS